jgi:hypothetical protein
MPLTQLAPPYPIFTDKNGDPLDAGFLYFGVVDQNPETNPIQVYFDDALTQPAAQPIRTINGYPSRNGSPAAIYTDEYFSITVRNKKNELVIYAPSGYGITPGTSASFTDQMTYNEGSLGAVDRTLTSRLQDYVSVEDFGAVGDGVTDDTDALEKAFYSGKNILLSDKDYVCTRELAIITPGQIIQGQGRGFSINDGLLIDFRRRSRILFKGTGARYLKTRRFPRASAGDPTDAPLSTAINVQAEGVSLRDFAIWLDFDVTDFSPTNFGAEWDVGLFSGCVPALTTHNLVVGGYWRVAGVMQDVTSLNDGPKFTNPYNNQPFPQSSDNNIADRHQHYALEVRGGRIGYFIAGAIKVPGQQYFDPIQNQLVTDTRGSNGCSDTMFFGGTLMGPEHHSGWRLADPDPNLDIDNEPLLAPACFFLDGHGNTPSNDAWGGNLANVIFAGTRFQTREAIAIRTRFGSRLTFAARCKVDRGATGFPALRDTNGTIITINTSTNTYGPIAATQESWGHYVDGGLDLGNLPNSNKSRFFQVVAPRQSQTDGNNTSILESIIVSGMDGKKVLNTELPGFEARADGLVSVTRDNLVPFFIRRLNGNGILQQWSQDTNFLGAVRSSNFSPGITIEISPGVVWGVCTGTPNGQITSEVGGLMLRLDTGQVYAKKTGSGNTGWSTTLS